MSEMTDTASEPATITAEEVVEITREVWQSFLGIDLEPFLADEADLPPTGASMSGVVGISGAWTGSVAVECALEHARAAAEAMFAADAESLAPEEVADAWGELTNMVGGNIKSLLPAPSKLSLPSVAEGLSYTVRVPGAVLVDEVTLVCEAGPLHVSVWKV